MSMPQNFNLDRLEPIGNVIMHPNVVSGLEGYSLNFLDKLQNLKP